MHLKGLFCGATVGIRPLSVIVAFSFLLGEALGGPSANGGHDVVHMGDGSYMDERYMADAWLSGTGRQTPNKCVDIPKDMVLCRGIGYDKMRLPNLLDHDSISEMKQQSDSWLPLLGVGCHDYTKLFLCSLFSPVCLDRPIWPCRSLCEAVKAGCSSTMAQYGFPWPDMLRCDKFPPDNDLCIAPPAEETTEVDRTCAVCDHPETFEAFVNSYCSSEFTLRVRIEEDIVSGADIKLTAARKKKKYKDNGLTKKDLRNLVVYVEGGATCDCSALADSGRKGQVMLMGRRNEDGRLIATHVAKFDKRCKETRRAIRAIQKNADICKGGIIALQQPAKAPSAPDDSEKQDGNSGKKPRNERKKKKDELQLATDETMNNRPRDSDNTKNGRKDKGKKDRKSRRGKKRNREGKRDRQNRKKNDDKNEDVTP